MEDPVDPDAPRTINFKTLYWKCEDVESESGDVSTLQIHIGGRTEPSENFPQGQTVHCVVQNFTPYVYLELPTRIRWNKAKCIAVVDFFKKIMKTDAPIEYWLLQKYKLHHKKLCSTICLTFPTEKASKSLGSRCRNTRTGLVIDGVGTFKAGEFVVHETNVDPIIKFTASKRLKLASWVTVTETIRPEDEGMCVEDRKFTSADIDVYVDWLDVNPYTPEGTVIVKPKYMSFDIECNSKNHNSKLPDPEIPENCVFQISNTVGRFGDHPSLQNKTLFSLGNPHDIKGATVVRCLNEKDLFLKWREAVVRENPDVMVGYNTMKFDWNYMIVRAEKLGIYTKFAQISRIIGRRADLMKSAWSSSAYGEQNFRYLDPMGITNVDVLLEVERNYKLPKYTLDYVAEYFLKEHKDDITPRQLFMLFQLTMEMTPVVDALPRGVVPKETRVEIKKRIQDILPMRRCHGVVKTLRTSLMEASKGIEFQNLVRDAFTLTGTYNIQDTVLPVAICEKLNLWTTMEETSNTMNIPASYLHTRGQQIKVLAQVYRETIFNDLIIPFREKVKDGEGEKYQGAVVIEANPGDYDNVVCFDFESLYPSVMIAFNICYTTLLEDDDPTPDSECHVLDWPDHVGCPHDPLHRKKKPADVLCKQHHYRFKKVIFHPDGTKENEGLMPRLERNLLGERKIKKKEMAKLEARYKMATGLAEPDNIEFYKKMGWEIITKGSMTEKQLEILKVGITVLNAQQLALKISSNSMYGTLGAQNGPIPLISGAASVTAMGRMLIRELIRYILAKYPAAKLVYGDTDSSMITFKGSSTPESFELGDKISKEASHYLKCFLLGFNEDFEVFCPSEKKKYRIDKYPRDKISELTDDLKVCIYRYDGNPINLAFENLYKRYVLLTKKRYFAHAVNRKGEIIAVIKKGIVMARRDNSLYLRDTYGGMMNGILDRLSENEVMYILYDRIHKLFTRQIPDANLIVYTGIKTVINYAKKKEKKQGRTVIERVFIDEDGEPIADPIGPLDPRLRYPNLPQVLLSLKMLRRGDDVPPNTRLEYLYLENEDAEHQGEKAEDYTFYKENRDILGLKPDYLHYIEKQLAKPITELLGVKYPREKIPYEKIDDALERCIAGLDELIRHRVGQVKVYERTVIEKHASKEKYGWCAKWCGKCKKSAPKRCPKHNPKTTCRTYTYRRKHAQVQYILDSAAAKKATPKVANEIDERKYPELLRICRLWKSRYILDALYKQHGVRKRPVKRPTQTGEKLRIKTNDGPVQVLLALPVGKYPKGTLVTLKAIQEGILENSAKKKKFYTYAVETPDSVILENVPRKSITTWRYRDGTLMKDVLLARGSYRCVVKHLDIEFCPLNFVGAPAKKVEIFEVAEENSE